MNTSVLQTLRRTAREAVIFTLLGPVAATLGYLVVQGYHAPAKAPHTAAKMCPNYLSDINNGADVQQDWWAQQETLPCMSGAQKGDTLKTDDENLGFGLHTVRLKTDLYIQGYDQKWIRFPDGYTQPVNSLQRVVNNVPLSAYLHPTDAFLFAIVFGWPLGFVVWMAYRILRFAIKG